MKVRVGDRLSILQLMIVKHGCSVLQIKLTRLTIPYSIVVEWNATLFVLDDIDSLQAIKSVLFRSFVRSFARNLAARNDFRAIGVLETVYVRSVDDKLWHNGGNMIGRKFCHESTRLEGLVNFRRFESWTNWSSTKWYWAGRNCSLVCVNVAVSMLHMLVRSAKLESKTNFWLG